VSSAALLKLAVKASLALIVFGVGLNTRPGDATFLLRHRGLMVRSILSMNVILPLAALLIVMVFPLAVPVKVALITLSISPVPPFLPTKTMKSGGDGAYTVGLLTVASLIAIVTIPVSMRVLGAVDQLPHRMSPMAIARLVAVGILVPLALGVVVRRLLPTATDRLSRLVAAIAWIALIIAFVPILVAAWPAMVRLIGNGTVLAFIAIVGIGLGVGHVLGGPERGHRTVLALATASRHPAIAIAIANANFPAESLAPAAILLELIVCVVVTAPYARRSKHLARDARRGSHHASSDASGRHGALSRWR
jgi:BASS family bile acid:Na+ symporter